MGEHGATCGLVQSPHVGGSEPVADIGKQGEGEDIPPKKSYTKKNKIKVLDNLVFGVDVCMDMAVSYLEHALIGKYCGRSWGLDFLKNWVHESWGEQIDYLLQICLLARGWLAFVLQKKEDADWVF